MATQKAPTKEEFLAALKKNGIKNLEDLLDVIMPETDETGGYIIGVSMMSQENRETHAWLKSLAKRSSQYMDWAEETFFKEEPLDEPWL